MALEKNSRLQNSALRRALHAALAIIPLQGTAEASAKAIRTPTEAAPVLIPAKRDVPANSQKRHIAKHPSIFKAPQPKDIEFMNGYLELQPKLRGAHLTHGGKEVSLPQFEEFCNELAIFCEHFAKYRQDEKYRINFSPETFTLIASINRDVNKKVKPITDIQQYGVTERWTVPDVAGDCEDYALLKLIRLIDAGFAPTGLHLLVVYDENNEGHAVLGVDVLVNGSMNTLVLDNLRQDIITLDAMERKYQGSLVSFVVQAGQRLNVRFFEYRSRR